MINKTWARAMFQTHSQQWNNIFLGGKSVAARATSVCQLIRIANVKRDVLYINHVHGWIHLILLLCTVFIVIAVRRVCNLCA